MATFATAAEVFGVFTKIDTIEHHPNTGTYYPNIPENPSWKAVLDWSLSKEKYAAGDTFKLDLPCVSKFTSTTSSVSLNAAGVDYATCDFHNGLLTVPFSELQCTVLPTFTGARDVSGTVSFSFVFNIGSGGFGVDLTCAKKFQSGETTITWNDGKKDVSGVATFYPGYSQDLGRLETGIFNVRKLPDLGLFESSFLTTDRCPHGYDVITFGMRVPSGTNIDCLSTHVGITNDLNDWYKPKSIKDFPFSGRCERDGYVVTMRDVPAGYYPVMDFLERPGQGYIQLQYVDTFVCAGYSEQIDLTTNINWNGYQDSDPGSEGNVVIYTTKTWTGSTTRVTTWPYHTGVPSQTITVEVDLPTSTNAVTTTTSTWTGTYTTTFTETDTPGGTDTVIIDVPTPTNAVTTTTSTWTGTYTTTFTETDTPGGTDTVVVDVPEPTDPVISLTSTWTGSTVSVTTLTTGVTHTVIVCTPSSEVVTISTASPQTDNTASSHTLTTSITTTAVVSCDECADLAQLSTLPASRGSVTHNDEHATTKPAVSLATADKPSPKSEATTSAEPANLVFPSTVNIAEDSTTTQGQIFATKYPDSPAEHATTLATSSVTTSASRATVSQVNAAAFLVSRPSWALLLALLLSMI